MMSFSHFSLNCECPGLNKELRVSISGTENCLAGTDGQASVSQTHSRHSQAHPRQSKLRIMTVESLITYRIRVNIYCEIDTACCSWDGFPS